jgi:caa(3)-type oxidase subunit IV
MRKDEASAGSYALVLLALFGLTGATVFLAFRDLGALNQPVALLIAGTKAILVGAVFMPLRTAPPLTRIFAAVGVLWLLLLIGLSYVDFHARCRVAISKVTWHM